MAVRDTPQFRLCMIVVAIIISTRSVNAKSLVFVVDTTGSMGEDIAQVRDGVRRIFQVAAENNDALHLVLVPFNDPGVGPALQTVDQDLFLRTLDSYTVQGGDDCPEMALSGIKLAIENSQPGSQIFVFTDASAKDYNATNEVIELVQRMQSQVVFVLTGMCSDENDPAYEAYERLASISSGQVFHLGKDDVDEVMEFIGFSIKGEEKEVKMVAIDLSGEGEQNVSFPVDSMVKEITISLTCMNKTMILRLPTGDRVPVLSRNPSSPPSSAYLEQILSLDNIDVFVIKNPSSGLYTIEISCRSSGSLRVNGKSDFQFDFGFATSETFQLNETNKKPVQGEQSNLLITTQGSLHPGVIDKVEFIDLHGQLIPGHVYEAAATHITNPGSFLFINVISPSQEFYIRVSGVEGTPRDNGTSTSFQRIASAPVLPDPCPANAMYFRSSCYFLIGERLIQPQMRARCQSLGAELSSITDEEENTFIAELIDSSNKAWIGAYRPKGSSMFQWYDGTDWAYTNWSKREPNAVLNAATCLEINFRRIGMWNDHRCKAKRMGVCKKAISA